MCILFGAYQIFFVILHPIYRRFPSNRQVKVFYA